jgi:CO dehydrogenase/acetyl-CoA synthase gamma subunit (corrinoid Fe-S protein)
MAKETSKKEVKEGIKSPPIPQVSIPKDDDSVNMGGDAITRRNDHASPTTRSKES